MPSDRPVGENQKLGRNKISELPEREEYWELEPSQNGPHHPNWRGEPYQRLTMKMRLKRGKDAQ